MNTITEVTRREIIDFLTLGNHSWHGRLSELKFLGQIFDLSSLPSTDPRPRYNKNAGDDIFQHRENNPGDWQEDWVFQYSPFDLLQGSDEQFLRFLCQTLHPVVRPKSPEAAEMVRFYNEQLSLDGWELIEQTRISSRPVYAARRLHSNTAGVAHVSDTAGLSAFTAHEASVTSECAVGTLDFASESGRRDAIAAYTKRWTCSEASLARTARVDPADLSKWKKGLLPTGSDKKTRIEETLKNNKPPTPPPAKKSAS